MTPFTKLSAIAAPLLRENIDTDVIIPSREMRSVSGEGLNDGLFAGWRYMAIGGREPNPDFVLNRPRYARAQILVTGVNFGCGSSREHAVWALVQYGFRVVIAPSFNPIFQGNCVANGVVPVCLHEDVVTTIVAYLESTGEPWLTVDLVQQLVSLPDGQEWPFDIELEARSALLEGLDPIGQTLSFKPAIDDFRVADRKRRPWVYATVERRERMVNPLK